MLQSDDQIVVIRKQTVYLPVLKQSTFYISILALFASCSNPTVVKHCEQGTVKRISNENFVVLLTDSVRLVKKLDSLSTAKFPYQTTVGQDSKVVDLSEFNSKKLFKKLVKLRERDIGASIIDGEFSKKEFDLVDTNYKCNWLVVSRKPSFFIVVVNDKLISLTYQLEVIDAINIKAGDPVSNNHFSGELNTSIYKNLKFKMHYEYSVQVDEERNFDEQKEDDLWIIDNKGHFKFVKTYVIKALKLL